MSKAFAKSHKRKKKRNNHIVPARDPAQRHLTFDRFQL